MLSYEEYKKLREQGVTPDQISSGNIPQQTTPDQQQITPDQASSNQQRPGILQSMAQGVAQPILKAGLTLAQPLSVAGKMLGGENLGQAVNETQNVPTDFGYLGKVTPIQSPSQLAGTALNLGSYLIGGEGATGLATGALKGVLPTLAKTAVKGALAGGMQSLGASIQSTEGQSFKKRAITAGVETGLGAVAGGILGAAGYGIGRAASQFIPKDISSVIKTSIMKAIRPSTAGKATSPQLSSYLSNAVQAVYGIVKGKSSLQFTDEYGGTVRGQLPRSLSQFGEAIDQIKTEIFNNYNSKAIAAGKKGIQIDTAPIVTALRDAVRHTPAIGPAKAGIKAAQDLANDFERHGSLNPLEAQEMIKNFNNSLKAYYKNPSPQTANQATAWEGAVRMLRQLTDESISKIEGPGYQQSKNLYGSLKAIEKDVLHRTIVEDRLRPVGLLDYTKIFSYADIAKGIVTGNPGEVVKGFGGKALADYFKMINDPNYIIEGMFNAADKAVNKGWNPIRSAPSAASRNPGNLRMPPTASMPPVTPPLPPAGQ